MTSGIRAWGVGVDDFGPSKRRMAATLRGYSPPWHAGLGVRRSARASGITLAFRRLSEEGRPSAAGEQQRQRQPMRSIWRAIGVLTHRAGPGADSVRRYNIASALGAAVAIDAETSSQRQG